MSKLARSVYHKLLTLRAYYKTFGFRGLWFWLVSHVLGNITEKFILSPGVSRSVRIRSGTSDVATYGKIFGDHEYAIELPFTPDVIVDAGANIGLASIYYLNRYPEATVFAIEPESANFAILQQNLNGYPRAVALHAALWSQDGEIELIDPGIGAWGFRTRDVSGAVVNRVPSITIKTLIERFHLDRIGLLKLDIEGAEKQVLETSGAWIERVDSVVAELHESFTPGCNRAFYVATQFFTGQARKGENLMVWRESNMPKKASPTPA